MSAAQEPAGSDGPVTVTIIMTFKDDALADAYCRGAAQSLDVTRNFKGCRDIRAFRHPTERNKILLFEEWDNVDDLMAYRTFRRERGDTARATALLQEPMQSDMWLERIA